MKQLCIGLAAALLMTGGAAIALTPDYRTVTKPICGTPAEIERLLADMAPVRQIDFLADNGGAQFQDPAARNRPSKVDPGGFMESWVNAVTGEAALVRGDKTKACIVGFGSAK
jgi:hypothetical protein